MEDAIMAGTSEGGKKSAAKRGYKSLSEAGRKGGQHSHSGTRQNKQGEEDTKETK